MTCRKCKKEIPDDSIFCLLCGAKQELPKRTPKHRGNGQGSVYKRGKTWTACATKYENNERYVKTKGGFKLKKDALDWLNKASFVIPKTPRTFKEIYDEWSVAHYPTISKKKKAIYEAAYAKCEKIHGKRWDELGIRHFQEIVNSAKATYYPRRDLKVLFSLMSQYAIISGYSETNFAPHVKLPPKDKPHKTPFSEDEIAALWRGWESGDEFAGVILIMIHTGMRYGEITTVKPENIHMEESYLTGGIKSEAGKEGEIILLDEIKPIVKALMMDRHLKDMSDTTFRKKFEATLSACGCGEHTTHECRHTCATLLAKAGIQPAIIKEIMRHSNYGQTMEYTHIDRETKLNALKAITNKLHADNEKAP